MTPTMNKEMSVLADALCNRIALYRDRLDTLRPMERKFAVAQINAYEDALALLFACGEPKPPTVHCAINTCNNPNRDAAWRYQLNWLRNGRKVM